MSKMDWWKVASSEPTCDTEDDPSTYDQGPTYLCSSQRDSPYPKSDPRHGLADTEILQTSPPSLTRQLLVREILTAHHEATTVSDLDPDVQFLICTLHPSRDLIFTILARGLSEPSAFVFSPLRLV